jgi:hypothetical protein
MKWTNVKDSLPIQFELILFYVESGEESHICKGYLWTRTDIGDKEFRFLCDRSNFEYKIGTVTHWMDLPEEPE